MTMVTVQGYIDGVSYTAVLGDDQEASVGVISGSPRAVALVAGREGEMVDVTPSGPTVRATTESVEGCLAVLQALTQVTDIDTDDGTPPPNLEGNQLPGVAY